MQIIFILVPATLILVGVGIAVFSWAVRNGQYDDLEGPAHRILYDDDEEMIPPEARQPDGEASKEPSADSNKSEENDPR